MANASSPENPRSRRTLVLWVLVGLVVGLVVGFFVGRYTLEQSWSSPVVRVTPDMARASSSAGADPTPEASARVLRPMPLARTRQALVAFTHDDPVIVQIGSLGRGDGMELTLRIENRGKCEVTSVKGVAYGFDAWNKPARLNAGGEHYVTFRADKLSLPAGSKAQPTTPLKHPDTASIVVGHIDEFSCADGTSWRRPG